MLSVPIPCRLSALGFAPALWAIAKPVVISAMLILGCSAQLAAAEHNFTNANWSNLWSDPLNWVEGTVPPDDGSADIVIVNNTDMTIYLGQNRDINSLTFTGQSRVVIRDAVLTVRSGEVTAGPSVPASGLVRIKFESVLSGDQGLQLTGRIPMGAFNSNGGTLFEMVGNNTYLGTTIVSNSGVQIQGAALPEKFPAGSPLVLNASSIDLMGKGQTYAGLSGNGKLTNTATNYTPDDMTMANIVPLHLVVEGNHVFNGTIGNDLVGNGFGVRLIKSGSGTQVLYGQGPYFGGTLISEGTLEVNAALRTAFPEGEFYDDYVNMTLDIEVASGATLAGHGSVGHIIANANSFINLGATSERGPLNALSANLESVTVRARVAGSTYDALLLSGAGHIGGSSHLQIDLSGLGHSGVFPIIVVDEVGGFTGAFESITLSNVPNGLEASYLVHDQGVNLVVVGGDRMVSLLVTGQEVTVEHRESGAVAESNGVVPASFAGLSSDDNSTFVFEVAPDAVN